MEMAFSDQDSVDTNPGRVSKRQKISHHDQGISAPIMRHHDYTIAWICALHIELAAARAMLDEVHEALPRCADDSNTYVLGSIKQHKIVIACLPADQYGTINAANVVTNMMRTFSSIRAGFMVGIGGGAPSRADVRLGDIVVGTRVMQYDFGKNIGEGHLRRTAPARIPGHLLLTAVSALRSKHERESSRVAAILLQKLDGQIAYHRPSSKDLLFQPLYGHESLAAGCDACDHSKLVPRTKRLNDIMIHYGAVASGNQVMRNGKERDQIARELDVMCFEMETAGLMDVLPCLPIRGICDYSDSHKNKEWQRHAAAIAAAYARELLEILPVDEAQSSVAHQPGGFAPPSWNNTDSLRLTSRGVHQELSRRQQLLDALRFDQIDHRLSNVKGPHHTTCRWFLNHPSYQAWLDPRRLVEHHGFLWIRGKPGSGKSTIMKFAFYKTKRMAREGHDGTASFFFNARGEYLEQSISGMYRSLLLQLLQTFPDLQTVLDDCDLVPQSRKDCPSLNVLKRLFRSALFALRDRSFTCFVDALDECDEQQTMDMVQYFEELAENSTQRGVSVRICFSSRHYPYIDIRIGIRLTLEDQLGHAEDLASYVSSRLRITNPTQVQELQPQILEKASGVFLWVIVVVDILNKEHRRGRPTLNKSLAELPSDLSKLFKNILMRDNENMEDLLLCVIWILFAKRPLRPEEFYHALWSGLSLKGLADSEVPVAPLHAGDIIDRYVISSSKGLAEITKTKQPIVQFMHESVRDFFIKDNGLHELWPEFGFDLERPSHDRLKQCCEYYMHHGQISNALGRVCDALQLVPDAKSEGQSKISKKYPFLNYASGQILYHADAAALAIPQDVFLSCFPVHNWIRTLNLFAKFRVREYSGDTSLLYILAEKGFSQLIRVRVKADSRTHIYGGRYGYPLFAALATGNKDAVAALLSSPSITHRGVDIAEGLNCSKDLRKYKRRTPLSWAAENGREGLAELLLEAGASINEIDEGGSFPLSRASENGHEAMVKLLLEKGADLDARDSYRRTPLLRASNTGAEAVVRLLLERGADTGVCGYGPSTPLMDAVKNGHEPVVRLLLAIDNVDVNFRSANGNTPLLNAARRGNKAIVQLLLTSNNVNVDVKDINGITPLSWAARHGYADVVQMLLATSKVDVNSKDRSGWTPSSWAAAYGQRAVIRLLDATSKVNIDSKNHNG